MSKVLLSPILASLCVAFTLSLAACSPKYDWRAVRGSDIPYSVLLPAKPKSATRPVDLEGLRMTMTMTAAEAGDVTFAVGAAELPDAASAQRALVAMKTALLKNIGGSVRQERISADATALTMIDIEATGTPGAGSDRQPRLVFARFVAKDKRVYQLVAIGQEKAVSREAVDTFLTSFKPE